MIGFYIVHKNWIKGSSTYNWKGKSKHNLAYYSLYFFKQQQLKNSKLKQNQTKLLFFLKKKYSRKILLKISYYVCYRHMYVPHSKWWSQKNSLFSISNVGFRDQLSGLHHEHT